VKTNIVAFIKKKLKKYYHHIKKIINYL
jgi:hypothetical protein